MEGGIDLAPSACGGGCGPSAPALVVHAYYPYPALRKHEMPRVGRVQRILHGMIMPWNQAQFKAARGRLAL